MEYLDRCVFPLLWDFFPSPHTDENGVEMLKNDGFAGGVVQFEYGSIISLFSLLSLFSQKCLVSASQEINSLCWPSVCTTRETKFSGANADREILIFPVQLTTSRIGNFTRLIHTLAICVTIHTCTVPGIICIVSTFSRVWINRGYGSRFCMYCTWYHMHCQHFQQSMDQPGVWLLYV